MESPIANLEAQLYTTKMCHYDGQIREIEQNLPHILSGWFLAKLWTKTWYVFSVRDLEKCKETAKIGEILFGGPRTEKKFRKND